MYIRFFSTTAIVIGLCNVELYSATFYAKGCKQSEWIIESVNFYIRLVFQYVYSSLYGTCTGWFIIRYTKVNKSILEVFTKQSNWPNIL